MFLTAFWCVVLLKYYKKSDVIESLFVVLWIAFKLCVLDLLITLEITYSRDRSPDWRDCQERRNRIPLHKGGCVRRCRRSMPLLRLFKKKQELLRSQVLIFWQVWQKIVKNEICPQVRGKENYNKSKNQYNQIWKPTKKGKSNWCRANTGRAISFTNVKARISSHLISSHLNVARLLN